MRQAAGPPHPGAVSLVCRLCGPPDEAQPNFLENAGAHSRIGEAIDAVKVKFAQAVIVEAELHRRRFPNLACGGSRVHST